MTAMNNSINGCTIYHESDSCPGTTASCTLYTDYTYDTPFCHSVGAESFVDDISTLHSRYISFDVTNHSSFYTYTTSTEFDKRCLPGPLTDSRGNACGLWYEGETCPRGHSAVETVVYRGTTVMYCCPISPALQGINSHYFFIRGIIDEIIDELLCEYSWLASSATALPDGISSEHHDFTESFKPTHRNSMLIRPIIVNPPSTQSASPGSTSSLASTTPPPPATATTATAPPSPPGLTRPPNQLSTSTKIGIGVGAGIGGLLLLSALATILFLFRRYQKSEQERKKDKPELHGDTMPKHRIVGEIKGEPIHELGDTSSPVEIGVGEETGNQPSV
ncbi:hypothetical protein BDV95DRAFT_598231 [Massariosphaeria phaeospora]|uniref:Mid2 domain-containing protein n=1 Tax=Massariosphaeria phaeospora TaxID=100035 RepID=A0A7C8I3D6_9PLEO|nr:hypothetical protein BDV95DRAFT_598231 [Massariosphaeria phaeospora]